MVASYATTAYTTSTALAANPIALTSKTLFALDAVLNGATLTQVTLRKIKSNHAQIADKYTGWCQAMPTLGHRFMIDRIFQDRGVEVKYLLTTPVISINQLSERVTEFKTKNSEYSLEVHTRPAAAPLPKRYGPC